MLTLGFGGILCELAAGMVCKVVHSDSSRGGGGILILMYRCLFVVILAPLCSGSGKVVITGSSFPFRPTG